MAFALLMLLAILAHHATSIHIDLNPSVLTNTSNRITPHCFTPTSVPDIQETNLADCNTALRGAFRYADVLLIAKLIVENCVGKEEAGFGTLNWGGVDQILDSETFYVSVGKPHEPIPPSTGAGSLMLENLTNGTTLDQAIEVA